MKNFILAIVAIFLLQGVSSNVTAQNPVKRVKYLKHVYEGEVGKKKVPEGKGTMTFEGFTVTGDFMGNEVTNATLSIDNSDITYNGNLSFDESQNVTLKHGGVIKTSVLGQENGMRFVEDENGRFVDDNVKKNFHGLRLIELEKISTEKMVSINYFIRDKIEFQDSIPYDWAHDVKALLNPPVTYRTYNVTAEKKLAIFREGWGWTIDGSPSIGDRVKILYVISGIKNDATKNLKYKDEQGRIWNIKVEGGFVISHLEYPNGSIIRGFAESTEDTRSFVSFKIIRPDNIEINSGGLYCDVCKFYDNNNKIFASIPCKKVEELDQVLALMDSTNLLKLFTLPSDHIFPTLYGENLSEKEIENILNYKVFPKFRINIEKDGSWSDVSTVSFSYWGVNLPSNLEHLKNEDMIVIKGNEETIGYYLTKTKTYISKSQLEGDADRDDQKKFDRLLAQLDPIKKRFGFNPLGRGLKDIVKVGTSFKLISDYFRLTKKYFYCYRGQSIYFKDTFPGEEFINLRWGKLSKLADEKKIDGEGYYYTHLSIDHGTRKCYDLGYLDRFDQSRRICYVWVTGDKITSVAWY